MIYQTPLKALACVLISATALAGCSTSQMVSASADQQSQTTRRIVGTSLIGCDGVHCVDPAVAGLCAAKAYTPSECRRHGELRK